MLGHLSCNYNGYGKCVDRNGMQSNCEKPNNAPKCTSAPFEIDSDSVFPWQSNMHEINRWWAFTMVSNLFIYSVFIIHLLQMIGLSACNYQTKWAQYLKERISHYNINEITSDKMRLIFILIQWKNECWMKSVIQHVLFWARGLCRFCHFQLSYIMKISIVLRFVSFRYINDALEN